MGPSTAGDGILPRKTTVGHPICAGSPRFPMKKIIVLLCLIASGCQMAPVLEVARGHMFTVELPVRFSDSPDLLEVFLHQGLVVVEPGPELRCELQVDLTAPHPEHVAALAQQLRLLLDEDQVNGRTTLGVAQPDGVPLGAVHARYRLQVPPDVRLRIETRDGNVHLRGFRGNAEVRSENGFIEARMDGGSVQLTTVTGRIRLHGTYTDAVLSSESGSVEARIPGDQAPVSLELVSVRGAVLVDLPNARALDLEYQGDPRLIDADMPLVWWSDDGDLRSGRVGRGQTEAHLTITNSAGPVRFRRLMSASLPAAAAQRISNLP